MPGTDSWQMIREVRANPHTGNLPIVVMSDNVGVQNVTSYEVQANVCKPIDEAAVLDILDEVLCLETVSSDRW